MEKWIGKVAVVTGASSGIGAETCRQLVDRGMVVVGFARRIEKLQALQKELNGKRGKFHFIKVDLCSEENIVKAFEWVKSTLKSVDVLVNNAGVYRDSDIVEGNSGDWQLMFDTNVLASCICSKETVNIMKELKINGHIVNINSDVGHYPPTLMPNFAIYGATKFSSVLVTESLREQLALQELPIRVTSISPGLVNTEMVNEFCHLLKLEPSDIADAILYALAVPQSVNIAEMIIRPTGETMLPFVKSAINIK